MKIYVDPLIFQKVPDYKIGIIVVSGFDNSQPIPEPEVKIEPDAARQRTAWEEATKAAGVDPVKFPPANVNLFRRFEKSSKLPVINPLVDICNTVSLETGAPNGAHDIDKDPGDIGIRPGNEGDFFIPLGGGEPEPVVDPVVFASANRIQVRNWTWRISNHCIVDNDTKTAVIFVDTLPPFDMVKTLEVMTKITDRVVSALGGKVRHQTVLDRDNPETAFSVAETVVRDLDTIDDFLLRGVANIIPSKEKLDELLRSGKRINVYNGIDPTSAHIHLGNAFQLRKLQRLVELGHHVTFLIGDFTTLVGDTSDKESERPRLSKEEIEKNFQTYKAQAEKILDFSKVRIVHNSDWLGKLDFRDILRIFQHFSVGDFISRELIRRRLDSGARVRLDELIYPVLQGYDSYHMDTDLQIGGTDQTFNMQSGRVLIHDLRAKESFVLTSVFLEGTDGRKMSKSWGNAVWLDDPPEQMYGKLMSVKDELIVGYFTLATNLPLSEIAENEKRLAEGENPMIIKKELAHRVVNELYGKNQADLAQKQFEETFQEGKAPSDVLTVKIGSSLSGNDLIDLIAAQGLVKSKSEVRRLLEQGAISVVDGEKVIAGSILKPPLTLHIGKRSFIRLV